MTVHTDRFRDPIAPAYDVVVVGPGMGGLVSCRSPRTRGLARAGRRRPLRGGTVRAWHHRHDGIGRHGGGRDPGEGHGSCTPPFGMGEHDDDLEMSAAAQSGGESEATRVAAAVASGLKEIALAIERGLEEVAQAIAGADTRPPRRTHKR